MLRPVPFVFHFMNWCNISMFKSSGNTSSSTQLWKSLAIKLAKISSFILIAFVGMSSFWQALTTLKLLITFSTSVLLGFLKFSTESKFFFCTLIILGCWSNSFVVIYNGLLIGFGSTALLFIKLGIFKLEIVSEK